MRFREFDIDLHEGGKSSGKRYNSEIGMMLGLLGLDLNEFDPKNPETLLQGQPIENIDTVIKDIKRLLAPNWDQSLIETWYNNALNWNPIITNHLTSLGKKPWTALQWAGGRNISSVGPADVGFLGTDVLGISIKAEGGITLGNLTPRILGLITDRGRDVFHQYAQSEYEQMKQDIFNEVMNQADQQMGTPLSPLNRPEYSITANQDPNTRTVTYTCTGKSNFKGTRPQILQAAYNKNATWQRVFGNWFQENWSTHKQLAQPMFQKLGKAFELTIKTTLERDNSLKNILRLDRQPYFYASSTGLYYVPDETIADTLRLQSVRYAAPDGTSQLFKIGIGQANSTELAELDVYVRYANGMFATNPTVRVQNLNNPEFLGWTKLA